ncbi:MAG TPA: endolytic transglycosylase MltG [Candidatus Aquicultoraceae bacterium]|nr:endolytic transglycosylase MltG [Candidatus Aquicultoraceae bacterium]
MSVRKWSLAAGVALGTAAFFLFLLTARPSEDRWHTTKAFIPKGSTYPEIENPLVRRGLLRYPVAFRLLVAGTWTGRKLQHGEYAFPAPPSALELWEKIVNGDVAKYQVTIPAGSTIQDVARTLESLELADAEEFLAAATSPELAGRMGIPGSTAEGYLFPDTYTLVKDMPVEEIIGVMVRRFRRMFTEGMERLAARDGFTPDQIVTIASIIEKESGTDPEKPLISAVIRNRLAIGMPLQMDPTVIYGLKKFRGTLTKKDLRQPTPYNTYVLQGLPPGPISNPGLSSLEAAVRPSEADYLYFVSRNDGTHQFSRTLREHNEAVMTYRKERDGNVARRDGTGTAGNPAEAQATLPPRR